MESFMGRKPSHNRGVVNTSFIVGLLAAIGESATLSQAGVGKLPSHPTPLTRITLSSNVDAPVDADDPGTGGAFNNTAYFQNKLANASQIRVCVNSVKAAASAWAAGFGLTPAFQEVKPAAFSIHYVKPSLSGLFAVEYQVDDGVKAKVRVDFYQLDGSEVEPETVQELLGSYKIADFQDALDKALRCDTK
jgi:hypothetical protein